MGFLFDGLDEVDAYIKDIATPVKITTPTPVSTTVPSVVQEVTGAKDMKKAGAEAALDVAATAGDVTRAMASGYEEIAKIQLQSASIAENAAKATGNEARKQTLSLLAVKQAYDANVQKLDADINNPVSLRNKAADSFVEASLKKLEATRKLEATVTRETTGAFDWIKKGFEIEADKNDVYAIDMRQQAAAGILQQQTNLLTSEGANLRANTLAVDNESAANASLIASAALYRQAQDSKAQAVGTGINMIQMGWNIGSQRAGLVLQAAQAVMSEEQFAMQRERFNQESQRLAQDERFSAQSYNLYLDGLRISGADTKQAVDLEMFKRYMTNKNPDVARFVSIGMMNAATGVERIAANPADAAVAVSKSAGAFANNPTAKAYAEFVVKGASGVAQSPVFRGLKPDEQQRQINQKIEKDFLELQNDAEASPLLKSPGPMVIGKAKEMQSDKWFQTVYGAAYTAGSAAELSPNNMLTVTRNAIINGALTPTEAVAGIKKYYDQAGLYSGTAAIKFGLPQPVTYKIKLDGTVVGAKDRIDLRSEKELNAYIATLVSSYQYSTMSREQLLNDPTLPSVSLLPR